jgi:hypothetical protein
MADEQVTEPPDAPSLSDVAGAVVEKALTPSTGGKIENLISNAIIRGEKAVAGTVWEVAGPVFRTLLKVLLGTIEAADPALDDIAKIGIDTVLGERAPRGRVPDNAGKLVLEKLAPAGGAVQPDIGPAAKYLTSSIHQAIEVWVLGLVSELVVDAADIARGSGATLESMSHLREVIDQITGGGRITRRVLAPFIDAGIVTPARWAMNKQYRPELLSLGAAVEAYIRGDLDFPALNEELGRQGFSAERIDTIVRNAEKRLAFEDHLFRHFRGEITDAEVAQLSRSIGYDPSVAFAKITIEDNKRIDALKAPIVTEAVANYVNGDLSDAQLEQWVRAGADNPTDADRIVSTAKARRSIHVRRISSSRIRQMVLDGIAAVPDFVRALEREGYPPGDIVLEELALRLDLKQKHDIQQKDPTIAQLEAAVLAGVLSLDDFIRAPSLQALTEQGRAVTVAVLQARIEKQAADAQAKADAAAEKAARDAEIAAKRARAFPSLQEYRRAYVRGFIGRDVYGAALEREKVVGDDAAFLLSGADDEREQFLADEEKRQQQLAAGDHKNLGIATLEQAVLAGELEVSGFDSYLAKVGYTDDDRRLLVRMVQDRLEDQAAAKAKRDAAEKLAAAKQVSLADWERAVRLGVRTIAQYGAFLTTLALDDPARALILDVLRAEVAADQAARAKRDARDAEAQKQGISLAQRRRTVIAGVRPRVYYEDAIRAAGWSVDDQLADLDLLDVEIAAAAEARKRRGPVIEKLQPSILTVSQLEHALVLNLITQTEFVDALLERGASEADADLLLQLALAKVADARAAATLHDQVQRELAAKGVSLAELEAAVRRGIVTLDDFALDLSNRGLAGDQVQLLRQLLEERVGVDVDELRAKIVAALTKAGAAFTLDELDAALAASEIDPPTFQAALEGNGAPRDAALVYTRLRTV